MSNILLSQLYEGKSFPSEESYYKNLLADSNFHSIAPQIYCLLKQMGREDEVPLFFRSFLKDMFNRSSMQNLLIKSQTENLLKAFEQKKFDVIPLKGTVFAENYFGYLGARLTSDIDLLIRRKDLVYAVEVVKSFGYTIEEDWIPDHFHCSLSKSLPGSDVPLTVELHWDIIKENTADFNIEECWKQSTSRYGMQHVRELSLHHTFYFICLHGWRHNLQSLKYFVDIIHIIVTFKNKLDFDLLFEEAKTHNTHKRLLRTLSIVYHEYPFLQFVKPLNNKIEVSFWNAPPKSIKRYINYFDYQFRSFDKGKHRFKKAGEWFTNDLKHLFKSDN